MEGAGLGGWQSVADMIEGFQARVESSGTDRQSVVGCPRYVLLPGAQPPLINICVTNISPFLGFHSWAHLCICWPPKRGKCWQRRPFLFSQVSARLPSLIPSTSSPSSHPPSCFRSSEGKTHYCFTFCRAARQTPTTVHDPPTLIWAARQKIPKTIQPAHRGTAFAQPQAKKWCYQEIDEETWIWFLQEKWLPPFQEGHTCTNINFSFHYHNWNNNDDHKSISHNIDNTEQDTATVK